MWSESLNGQYEQEQLVHQAVTITASQIYTFNTQSGCSLDSFLSRLTLYSVHA